MSSTDERERRNSRSFAPDLPLGLKDLSTVYLFSVYLLSRVDIVILYIEVDFTFGLPDYVRYSEVRYIEVLFHTFYCNFSRDISFVVSRTSLNLLRPFGASAQSSSN